MFLPLYILFGVFGTLIANEPHSKQLVILNPNLPSIPLQFAPVNPIIYNFFNGTHQFVIFRDLSFQIIQVVNIPNLKTDPNAQYLFTNGTHDLRIFGSGRSTISSRQNNYNTQPAIDSTTNNFMTVTLQPVITTPPPTMQPIIPTNNNNQQTNIVTQPSNSYPIFTVSNGTHQITVNNDLSFRIVPLPVPQINFIDVNSQYVFCNGVQELGIYGNGRIVYLPMFYSYPAFITPVYVPKYVITGFFNGTHRVTVYNDGQVYATPMVYFYPQPVFYDANLVRTDLNNGTHDIKVFNSGRLLVKRLPIFG